jgi:hypothetical protein
MSGYGAELYLELFHLNHLLGPSCHEGEDDGKAIAY